MKGNTKTLYHSCKIHTLASYSLSKFIYFLFINIFFCFPQTFYGYIVNASQYMVYYAALQITTFVSSFHVILIFIRSHRRSAMKKTVVKKLKVLSSKRSKRDSNTGVFL